MTAPVGVTTVPYPLAYRSIGLGRVNLQTDTIRVMLATNAYIPAATHEFLTSVQPFETAGAGYTAGGTPLPNRTFAYDTALGKAVLTCDPIVYPAASFIARHAVIFAAVAAGNVLLARTEFFDDVDPAGTDFPLAWPAGVFRIGPTA